MTISRRAFTSSSMAALIGISLPGWPQQHAKPHDRSLPLGEGWDVAADGGVVQTGVTLPHTPAALSWRRWQPASWEKVWTYRKKFDLPPDMLRQRLFLHVERALAKSVVTVNGTAVAGHEGGFTPFECEITNAVHKGANEIVLQVDARWLNVPPAGSPRGAASVDYYLPGGITGDVTLRALPPTAITDLWSRARDVLSGRPTLDVFADLDSTEAIEGSLLAQLRSGTAVLAETSHPVHLPAGRQTVSFTMPSIPAVTLWSPDTPQLYELVVTFTKHSQSLHSRSARIGFREARFDLDGFYLNGRKTRLFGLNRHELFPYVGFAASPRATRHDAEYLRHALNCNVVRCSHYPQSTAFLDACDELGLMVWEEIPGWQYLGDTDWKQIAVRNVAEMVRRDRNHPSIIVWGTRINESANDPELYRQTRELAHQLDPSPGPAPAA